jgi:F-type H+-transporting ATPase subunit epsilon
MAGQVEFELVSPERLLLSEPVDMVVVPGAEGDFGVLPGHAPLISGIRTGVIATYEDGRIGRRIFVSGGFAEVTPERCTVLADEAVSLDGADRAAAEARVAAARQDVQDAEGDTTAQARLDVAEALLAAIDAT